MSAKTPERTLRLILGDQLSHDIAALQDRKPDDLLMLCEVQDEIEYVPHHKQKIALILAAMRHFAAELEARGAQVHYIRLDARDNSGSFTGEVERAIKHFKISRLIVTEPGEWRVREAMETWEKRFDIPVDILSDTRFFCSGARFSRWARGRRSLRMEYFYREMRRETGLLMEGDKPVGGEWNYDAANRKPWPKRLKPPHRLRFKPDAATQEVLDLVQSRCAGNFGTLDAFDWAVTAQDACRALDDFIEHALPQFGDYQDAMKADAPFLNHALLSAYLNIGLLDPMEVCKRAEMAWRQGQAPLESVEGFIRQILGWREFIRGVYWLKMPEYARSNALQADRKLPWLYWSGETDMVCMAQSIGQVRDHAYGHHIQRLMITGNFALLAGVAPADIEHWYLAVYIDAFEWVELPNVHGMAIYADGGVMSSKPYAASGRYIDRMSDYCGTCRYDLNSRVDENACPFTVLYWDFMIRNEPLLKGNPRMGLSLRNVARIGEEERQAISNRAKAVLKALD